MQRAGCCYQGGETWEGALGRGSQEGAHQAGATLASALQMGLSSSHDSTSVSPRFTRTPGKRDGYFVHPHAHMTAVWSNYQVNSCHWKAFFSYYSDSQICNVRDLGNVHPDAFVFPCRKTEAQGTQWEVHNHRTQSENSEFLRSKQSSALSTIARGHHLSCWLRSRSTAGRAPHRNHEIAAALNWWHSVI